MNLLTCQVPLIPKLRGYFAEFLHHDYLDRLGILYQSTCVGLGYGRYMPLAHEAFLGSIGSLNPTQKCQTHHVSENTIHGFAYEFFLHT